MDPTVAALLDEHRQCLQRGLSQRAAAVEAELTRLGYEAATAEPPELPASAIPETTTFEAAPEQAIPPRPRPRKRVPDAP